MRTLLSWCAELLHPPNAIIPNSCQLQGTLQRPGKWQFSISQSLCKRWFYSLTPKQHFPCPVSVPSAHRLWLSLPAGLGAVAPLAHLVDCTHPELVGPGWGEATHSDPGHLRVKVWQVNLPGRICWKNEHGKKRKKRWKCLSKALQKWENASDCSELLVLASLRGTLGRSFFSAEETFLSAHTVMQIAHLSTGKWCCTCHGIINKNYIH